MPVKLMPPILRPLSTVMAVTPVPELAKVAMSVLVVLPLVPPGTPALQVASVQLPVAAVPVHVELAARACVAAQSAISAIAICFAEEKLE